MCGHTQEMSFECDVCGRDLSDALGTLPPMPTVAESLDGLELTHHETAAAAEGTPPVEDLEHTRMAPVATPIEAMSDVEATHNGPIGEVQAETVDELDRGREAPTERTELNATPPCRACGHVQLEGLFCDRCGLRRAVVVAGLPAAQGLDRCAACGVPLGGASRCRDCGHPAR